MAIMDLYNSALNFKITTKDNLEIGQYIINLSLYDIDYDIYRVTKIDYDDNDGTTRCPLPYFTVKLCAKVSPNNEMDIYIGHDYGDTYPIGSYSKVIVPKEYNNMIDKVLVFG
jgi:hypothetical protein